MSRFVWHLRHSLTHIQFSHTLSSPHLTVISTYSGSIAGEKVRVHFCSLVSYFRASRKEGKEKKKRKDQMKGKKVWRKIDVLWFTDKQKELQGDENTGTTHSVLTLIQHQNNRRWRALFHIWIFRFFVCVEHMKEKMQVRHKSGDGKGMNTVNMEDGKHEFKQVAAGSEERYKKHATK